MIRLERIKTWSLLAVLSTYTDIPIDGKVAEILDYAARIKVQESAP
jgi:hypothetical protein